MNAALEKLSPRFSKLYATGGRASIAPEKLLRALLLQAFYGVRSERQLMEQITYNMLFRWFLGLSMDAPVWDVTVFTKNRERLLAGNIAIEFLTAVISDPAIKGLLSNEHFSVDGTLIDAWASMKSFRRKDGTDDGPASPGRNAERDFHGEQRSNETHASTTDPDARLYRKARGQPSRLCYMSHLLIENRNGLIVDVRTSHATGRAEREAAEAMIAAMPPSTWPICGRSALPRTWRKTSLVGARPSTVEPPAIPAMRSASASASGSRSPSAGSRPAQACARPAIAGLPVSAGWSP
jgi:transposase